MLYFGICLDLLIFISRIFIFNLRSSENWLNRRNSHKALSDTTEGLKGVSKCQASKGTELKVNEKEGTEDSFCCIGLGAEFLFQDTQEETVLWDSSGENRTSIEILLELNIQ